MNLESLEVFRTKKSVIKDQLYLGLDVALPRLQRSGQIEYVSMRKQQGTTRWSVTLSSKIIWSHAINFIALCGANLVS
jgi:hypothetical protein